MFLLFADFPFDSQTRHEKSTLPPYVRYGIGFCIGWARARARVCIGLHWFCTGLHWCCIGFALVCIGVLYKFGKSMHKTVNYPTAIPPRRYGGNCAPDLYCMQLFLSFVKQLWDSGAPLECKGTRAAKNLQFIWRPQKMERVGGSYGSYVFSTERPGIPQSFCLRPSQFFW